MGMAISYVSRGGTVMASQGRISVNRNVPETTLGNDHCTEQPDMRNMAFMLFHHKTAMSDDHWKQIGALLQKANEERSKVDYQEPFACPPEFK
jgi:hypothetical protein